MEENRVKNSTRNMIAGFIYKTINLLFPFVVNTIIIKTLGVEYLGLNMLFHSILQVLTLTELGFGTALIFSMYEPIAKQDYAKISALLGFYRKVYRRIGSIVFCGGLICMPLFPVIISGEVPSELNVYILFIISLVNCVAEYLLFAYKSALLIAYQRKDIIEKINIFIELLLNILKIAVLLITKNYYLFCIVMPFCTIINSILVEIISKKKYPNIGPKGIISKEEKKPIYQRVIGLSIHKFCNVICNSFDSIVISSILGIMILGQYNNYFVITNALTMLLCIITGSASSSIGNSLVSETKEKNYRDYNILQFGFSTALGWASICLACLIQPFIKLWVGKELMFDDPTAITFAFYLYALVSSAVFMTYREAAGIWDRDRVRPFFEAGFNLMLNIILAKTIGVAGVLISTIITTGIIRVIWGSYYLFKELFTEYSYFKYLLKQLLYLSITVVIGVIAYYVCSLITLEGIWGFVVKGATCASLSIFLYVIVYFKTAEFRGLMGLVKGMLKNK